MMRNPENVLNSLQKHSKITAYKFERLYRILFNYKMYHQAYLNIYEQPGNRTIGAGHHTIERLSVIRIEKLIGCIKDESYQPQSPKYTYPSKKAGVSRLLARPSCDDELVLEVIRMTLEGIYDGGFEPASHGFRPNRSSRTALMQVAETFGGIKWFITGNIPGFFSNISYSVMISMLSERICDDRFIRLIRKFLNAGYIQQEWPYCKTLSGGHRGGLLSPMIVNVCLNKLDKWMKGYIKKIGNEKESKPAPLQGCQETGLLRKSLEYVRYADEFLIGVTGSLEDCRQIKKDITEFLKDKLALVLPGESMLITHNKKNVRFLSFDIAASRSRRLTDRNVQGNKAGAFDEKIIFRIPAGTIRNRLLHYGVLQIIRHNGKEQWKPKHRKDLIFKDDITILSKYNAELISFYNDYPVGRNSGTLHHISYIMEYSMYKTFAAKYSTTVWAICKKYKKNGVFTVLDSTGNRQIRFDAF